MIRIPTKTSFKAISAVVVALSLVAGPLPSLNQTAEAYTRPGYNGRIVFESQRDGNGELYIMDANGGDESRLTNTPGRDYQAQWSPNNQKIVYTGYIDSGWSNSEIYLMDSDGTSQTRLTNIAGLDNMPLWSPDGSRITFQSQRDGNFEIYIMDANGANQTRLTNTTQSDLRPQFSPDGSKILFESLRDGNREIYTMNTDGSGQTRLTFSSGDDGSSVWSPDGTKIAFYSERADDNYEIFVMNADGSNQNRLTQTPLYEGDFFLKWSPDGSRIAASILNGIDHWWADRIALITVEDSSYETIDLRGDNIMLINDLQWAPDGGLLITGYDSISWTNSYLYLIKGNGTDVTQLTFDGSSDYGIIQSIPNTPPVTASDSLSVPYQTPALADVLANDTDEEALDGANLSITVQPSNGTTSIVDGKVRYVPNSGFQGSDSLTYEICDSFMLDQKCATGVLNITVQAPGAPAVSVNKVAGLSFNTSTGNYLTSSLRPTFSGTASPFAEIKVEIHSDPIVLTTTADGDGNWSVTPTFDIPSGEHMVYISATLSGITTKIDSFGLVVQPTLANTGENLGWILTLPFGAMIAGGALLTSRLKKQA